MELNARSASAAGDAVSPTFSESRKLTEKTAGCDTRNRRISRRSVCALHAQALRQRTHFEGHGTVKEAVAALEQQKDGNEESRRQCALADKSKMQKKRYYGSATSPHPRANNRPTTTRATGAPSAGAGGIPKQMRQSVSITPRTNGRPPQSAEDPTADMPHRTGQAEPEAAIALGGERRERPSTDRMTPPMTQGGWVQKPRDEPSFADTSGAGGDAAATLPTPVQERGSANPRGAVKKRREWSPEAIPQHHGIAPAIVGRRLFVIAQAFDQV